MSPIVNQPTSPASHSAFVELDICVCGKCGKNCEKTDQEDSQVLVCDKCDKRYHLNCTDLPPYELLKYLNKHNFKRKYVCFICVSEMMPREYHRLSQNTTTQSTCGNCPELRGENKNLLKRIATLEEQLKKEEKKREGMLESLELMEGELMSGRRRVEELTELRERCLEEQEKQSRERRELLRSLTAFEEEMKNQDEKIRELESRRTEPEGKRRSSSGNEHPPNCIAAALSKMNTKIEEMEKKMDGITQQQARKVPTCYYCGKVGHISRNCFKQRNDQWYSRGRWNDRFDNRRQWNSRRGWQNNQNNWHYNQRRPWSNNTRNYENYRMPRPQEYGPFIPAHQFQPTSQIPQTTQYRTERTLPNNQTLYRTSSNTQQFV